MINARVREDLVLPLPSPHIVPCLAKNKSVVQEFLCLGCCLRQITGLDGPRLFLWKRYMVTVENCQPACGVRVGPFTPFRKQFKNM